MKQCPKCQKHLPSSCFGKDSPRKDGLQVYCKECRQPIRRQWYLDNAAKQKKVVTPKNRERADRLTELVIDYLFEHPCVDCGESDPIVLDFDHVKGDKKGNISHMVSSRGEDTLKEEIKKCEVRCANCHRKKTAKQFMYRKYVFIAQRKEQLRPKEKAEGLSPSKDTTFEL